MDEYRRIQGIGQIVLAQVGAIEPEPVEIAGYELIKVPVVVQIGPAPQDQVHWLRVMGLAKTMAPITESPRGRSVTLATCPLGVASIHFPSQVDLRAFEQDGHPRGASEAFVLAAWVGWKPHRAARVVVSHLERLAATY